MTQFKWLLFGLPLAFVLLFLRNATYLYHDGYNYLASIVIGVFIGWAARKTNIYIAVPFIITLLVELILGPEKHWIVDIGVSMITILTLGTIIYYKRFIYACLFSVAYGGVVFVLLFVIVEQKMAIAINDDLNIGMFSINSLETQDAFNPRSETDGFILLYWHTGCSFCIKMENMVHQFLTTHPDINIEVINIESTGKIDDNTLSYAKKHHPYYQHFQDKNQVIQKAVDSQAGPMLVMIDKSGLVQHIYLGYNRNLDLIGSIFLKRRIERLI